mmetsp:Transcript_21101/g.49114  ORF Transcript_21101/g.49114 Transcript_21101/m.49114 type:complete len:214 (-) Transcript_21101:423-1064(-)
MVGLHVYPTLHLLLALGLHLLQDCFHHLIGDVGHVRATADGANRIHKADLVEAALCQAHTDLPTLRTLLIDLRDPLAREEVEIAVVPEVLHIQLLIVQKHTTGLARGPGDVVDTLGQQGDDVVVQTGHPELGEVGLEGDARKRLLLGGRDLRLAFRMHVLRKDLPELVLPIASLHYKLRGEDIRQLGPVAIPAPNDLAGGVVVVVAGQEVPED